METVRRTAHCIASDSFPISASLFPWKSKSQVDHRRLERFGALGLHELAPAVSSGERTGPGEDFTWFQPSECLSRAAVELSGDGVKLRP